MKTLPSNYINIQQNTPEWLQERTGCVTASRIADVVTKLKKGNYSASRETYKYQLLVEIVTGRAMDQYVSMAMGFGTENEPIARSSYEIRSGVEVNRIGYVRHSRISRTGASPDGLVGDDGLVEIKVPNSTTHLEYLLAQKVPEDYQPQMMWQMACTGREWCDFVSYDPRLPADYGLFVMRLSRDEKLIAEMELEVEKFIAELNETVDSLMKLKAA